MKQKFYLTVEESRKLIELGYDPLKASHHISTSSDPANGILKISYDRSVDYKYPIFSIGDLLYLVQSNIAVGRQGEDYVVKNLNNGFFCVAKNLIDCLYELLIDQKNGNKN